MPETPREHHQHGINICCLQAHKLTLPLGLMPISSGPVGRFTHPVDPVPGKISINNLGDIGKRFIG